MVDSKDLKIIAELNWNCRQAHTTLGKKLRLSKQVVRYRIHNLEKNKIIQSYHALIDWRRLGYNSIRVYLKWHNITPEIEEKIYQDIKKDPFFMWTVKFEGEMDIGFYLWVKSIPEFSEKWFAFLSKYRKYILKQEIYESVNMTHYPMKPLLTTAKIEEKILGTAEVAEYDSTDYQILIAVTENGQMPLVELAQKINLTPKAALYRLKKLEKRGIVKGYNALIDTNQLGYHFYKVDFYLRESFHLKEMFEFAKVHKNIVYKMRTIGGPDFEIEVMVKDINELHALIEEIRIKYGGIEYYRIHRFEYTIKQEYLPGQKV